MISVRATAAVLAGLVAGVGLTIPSPALADPIFVDADSTLTSAYDVDASGTGCTHFAVPLPPQVVPVHENGGSATVSTTATGSAAGPAPGDTASVSAQANATGSVSSTGGLPSSLDYTITGQISVVTNQPVSACQVRGYAEAELGLHFVLNAPGYLTAVVTNDAHSFVTFDLYSSDTGVNMSIGGFGWKSERRLRVRLPAGTYQGTIDGSVGTESSSSDSGSGTAEAHARFTPFGALTTSPAGAGARYVTLPAAAGCGTGTLDVGVTPKRKRVDQVRRLKFFLGDHLVKTVSHPKRGAVVHVPLDRTSPSELRTEVVLAPTRRHRHPRSVEVAAGYEACS